MSEFDFDSVCFGGFSSEPVVSAADLDEKVVADRAIKRDLRSLDLHLVKARQLSDLCAAPKPYEQWRIITEKQFNAFNLVLNVIESDTIERLYIAIYRINAACVDTLTRLICERRIKHATFVISSFFNQTKKPEQWAIKLCEFCQQNTDTCDFVYIHNHSKVICIQTANGDHYVFEGSGNMSDNARIEQYIYENCRETFDFHAQWMDELVNKMKENGKV